MRPLLLATLIATLAAPAPALAQSKPVDLTHASIDDLVNIEITSGRRTRNSASATWPAPSPSSRTRTSAGRA
jgi:hypothetical protein